MIYPHDSPRVDPAPTAAQLREDLRKVEGLYLTDAERAVRVTRELLTHARALRNPALLAAALMEHGRSLRQQPDLETAHNCFREALGIFTSLGDRVSIPKALQALGTIHSASGNLQEALRCFNGALPLAQASRDWPVVQRILNSWGIVAIRMGDYAGALQRFMECLASLREHPDLYLESSVLTNIGGIFERSQEYDKAIEHLDRSIAIARSLGDHRQVASSLIFLGNIWLLQNRPDKARPFVEETLSLCSKHEMRDLKSQALASMADLALRGSTPRDALSYLFKARELVAATPNKIHLQKVEHALGATYLQLDELDEAEACMERAIALAESIGSPQLLYESNVLCAEIATKRLDYRQANEYLRAALRHHEVLHSEGNQQAVRALEVQMALERLCRKEEADGDDSTLLDTGALSTTTFEA